MTYKVSIHRSQPESHATGMYSPSLGRCQKEARRQGVENDEIAAFLYEAESRDYDYALQTCFRWFTIT